MGRELQKRKNRSSIPKVRKKPQRKKKILNNHILAENWDKNETLAQNYRRLGLTVKLNKNTGGVEKKVSDVERAAREGVDVRSRVDPLNVSGVGRQQLLDVREARIERDPQTGAILRVVEDGSVKPNPLNDPLNALDSDSEDDGTTHTHVPTTQTAVVSELEREANRPEAKYKRKQSEGEKGFIAELVRKHGDDYAAMARDGRVNYMQRSPGDLKRLVRKWREEGGGGMG